MQGVRNLITVAGADVPDAQLEQKLATKLRYVRVGYDNTFDYFALGVKDGVVTVEGQDRTGVGRDEALAEIANMPGVKDVIDNVSSRTGLDLRRRPAAASGACDLSRSGAEQVRDRSGASDSHHRRQRARDARTASVDSKMDKQVAGIRANQLFGAFSVDNKLQVE